MTVRTPVVGCSWSRAHTSASVLLDADGRTLARTEKIGSAFEADFIAAVHRATMGKVQVVAR